MKIIYYSIVAFSVWGISQIFGTESFWFYLISVFDIIILESIKKFLDLLLFRKKYEFTYLDSYQISLAIKEYLEKIYGELNSKNCNEYKVTELFRILKILLAVEHIEINDIF
jgi:hypothetical protein